MASMAMGDTYWSFEGILNSAGDNTYTGTATSGVTVVNTTTTTGDVLGDGSSVNLGYALDFTDGHYVRYDNADLGTQLLYGTETVTGVGTMPTSYTLMGYVNFANVTGELFFFGTGSGDGTRGIALGVKDGKVDFLCKTVAHKTFDYTLTADTWYHLAFAYDHTDNTVELFVNGTSEGTITLGNTMVGQGSSNPNNTVYFGAASSVDAQNNFDGMVAHFQVITGQALGADAVKQYASTIIPEPATATLSLLALAGLAARRRRR